MSSLCILLISLIVSPVSVSLRDRSRSWTANFARAITSHQSVCIILTILSLASLSTSLVHCYLSGALFYGSATYSRHAALLLPMFSNVISFFSSGLMRRGPRLYYHVPAIQLGSGLRATVEEENEGLRRWLAGEGGVEPEGNVLDYDGCGILSLMLGSYVSVAEHALRRRITDRCSVLSPMAQVLDKTPVERVGPFAIAVPPSISRSCQQ